jgi:hypothetical protein
MLINRGHLNCLPLLRKVPTISQSVIDVIVSYIVELINRFAAGVAIMSSISAAMNFSTTVSQTMFQGSQQAAKAINEGAERLDRKKENISQQGLQAMQERQATAQRMDETRNKIDTYA